jgi:glutamate/tyrosine decarboxylase-like PLP-dependent enzyme
VNERELLEATAARAADFLESLPDRPVAGSVDYEELLARLGGPVPEAPADPAAVVEDLAAAAEPGIVASAGGRYFGFVTGAALPAALAADWLASAWDQNVHGYVASPAGAAVEEVCRRWLVQLLGLPAHASLGLVTGCQMANVVGLAAARNHVLAEAGWDVGVDGLTGAPPVRIVAGDERHVTIDRALRLLGFGTGAIVSVAADDQGRMRADAVRAVLDDHGGPTIVCAQAGNVNTGSFDPLADIAAAAREAGAWLHVDAAFGLWAAASRKFRHLVEGVELADSWAADAHKWLNVPYDCGLVLCARPDAHRAAMRVSASYLSQGVRDGTDWAPDSSRRARGFAVYAALRTLGRSGIEELVDRCCELAQRFAERLGSRPGVEILNDVVLNQVLVRFGDDDRTRGVIARVQDGGVCWLGGTTWQGRAAMRISVSSWRTTEADVDRSVEAILHAASSV